MREKCGEIWAAQKCKMQKRVCRVKHWKGRFIIGLNDSIKPLLY